MIAVFVNCAAVFAGSVLGLVFSRFISEKITKYLKNPNSTTCLVIIEPVGEKDFSGKSLAKILTNVD